MRLSLESFRHFLTRRDTWVLLKSDSTVTVGAVNHMASRSAVLMRELRRLHESCASWGLSIRAEYLPSSVNAYADRLSRESDSTDWALCAEAYAYLERRFGPHTLDLFATHLNAKCGRFYSRRWTPGCTGTDALHHEWVGENFYANPPFNLMPAVVAKAISDGTKLTLFAPRWEAQPWYWRAAEAAATIVHLPTSYGVFTHGTQITPARQPHWAVTVFRFTGSSRLQQYVGNVSSSTMPGVISAGTRGRDERVFC